MNRQRGVIAEGYIWLVGSIAGLAMLWGLVHGVTGYLDSVRAGAKAEGQAQCDAAYKARDNAQLAAALRQVKALEDAARKSEAEHAQVLADLNTQLLQEKENGKAAKARVLADLRAGRLQLRPGVLQTGTGANNGDQRPGPAPGPSAAGGDGTGTCKLSGASEEFLLGIASEADNCARTLAKAQAVILEDRRLCGTY